MFNKIFSIAILATLASMSLVACGESEIGCDDSTFERVCVDSKNLKICTHGEIAQQRCSEGQICKDAACIDDDGSNDDEEN